MSRCFCLCAFVCLIMTTGTVPADDSKDKKPEAALEGTWTLASLEVKGKKISEEFLVNGTITIKGNKYSFKMAEDREEGTLKVDAGKKPAHINLDIVLCESEGKKQDSEGKKQLGIYEVDATSLKLCFTDPGKEVRPTEFQANEGSNQTLFVFKKKP